MSKLVVAFRKLAKTFKKGKKEKWVETPEEENIGTCLEIFQVIFDSFRYGSFSYVLVTSSYSIKPIGSVSEIQSPSTQFPI